MDVWVPVCLYVCIGHCCSKADLLQGTAAAAVKASSATPSAIPTMLNGTTLPCNASKSVD